ncbi:ankyrin repeat-containing domain protein [Mycena olivaceomarginata]|nr:ankyrin repeat-containing domain protein [Mycena olivaceomarginata]
MASFGTTISSGIQDISAILSLLGTEQCELHVGSALRGGGGGGYLYAAITPVSIFGSLGAAKAAFSIVLASLPFGARKLKHMGFEPKGDVVAAMLLDGDRYLAETRLLRLLDKYYIRSAQYVSVERSGVAPRLIPLHPWDLRLLMTSVFVACLGVLPYVHFSVFQHTFPALAIFFPLCRVFGGALMCFPVPAPLAGQDRDDYQQRMLFKAINDVSTEHHTKIPLQHLLWDESCTSEACLSSLVKFFSLKSNEAETTARFVEHVAVVLNFPPESSPKEVADGIKTYLTKTWPWIALICALGIGFFMTIIGYIGCFTLVQGSSTPLDIYIWLSAESTLAFFRLLIWALNPPWDDSDGICLTLTEPSPLPVVTPTWVVIEKKNAYSGPMDIGEGRDSRVTALVFVDSWTRRCDASRLHHCEGQETVLCRMDGNRDMKFYYADIKFNPGHVVQKEELKKDHELVKEETNFKIDVFEHYHFLVFAKIRGRERFGPIKASWPLSESSSGTLEQGHATGEKGLLLVPRGWLQLVGIMDDLLAGTDLRYQQFSTCRDGMISNIALSDTARSKELHIQLSAYLSAYTTKIHNHAPSRDTKFKDYYNQKWEAYSKGIACLDRLFEPLNASLMKGEPENRADVDGTGTVLSVGLRKWKSNGSCSIYVRTLDKSRFLEHEIQERRRSQPIGGSIGAGSTEVVRLLLHAGADELESALRAASSSGHTAITAATHGQTDVVHVLLESGADVNASAGEYGSALQAASYHGHEEIVHLLLNAGADVKTLKGLLHGTVQAASAGHKEIVRVLIEAGAAVNTAGGKENHSILQAASYNGHADIARFLLKQGADVNTSGGKYGNALQAASYNGHEELARFLLGQGADAKASGGKYGNALQAASYNGHENIARLLFEKAADVNASGGQYGSALQAASYNGHEEITRFLLEQGADVKASGGKYGNALQAASYNGHEELARFLLEQGADVKASGGKYGNALQAASYNGHENIARLLFEKAADVNASGGQYGNALQAASYNGHADIARFLLEQGADVNTSGGKYGNALQAASYNGHEELARFLLEQGADVKASGGKYGNALQAASYNGHENIARLLFEKAADVNASGGQYGNALQAASYNGHADIARFLLEQGADVNTSGGKYGNALQAASYNGHADIARFLLEQGADVNTSGGKYGNALQAASYNGHEELAHFLLEQGADVNASGGQYGNALQAASYNGHENIAQLLLEKGAYVNASGGQHGSALRAASYSGHEEITRLLLQNGARTTPPEIATFIPPGTPAIANPSTE